MTSVSKKSEKASEAAASIFVITQEDIERSGMTSIPEVLRIVPGLNVAQSGSHQWAISARGFNDQFANKLLVLIDGRSVYTPLYSGVYWDVQDTPLQDIERIEVIRGPGATQWGANAVNGVINIITKNAKYTQGGLVSSTAGNVDRSLNTVRYGTQISENGYIRTYAKYDERDEVRTARGLGAHDAWNKAQAGFRADLKPEDDQKFTFQGDVYRSGQDYALNLPYVAGVIPTNTHEKVSGGNLMGKWNKKNSSTSEIDLQLYYDAARRNNLVFDSNVQTADIDLQHTWTELQSHEIISGVSYRLVKSDVDGTSYIKFAPSSRLDNLFSAFAQDKITLNPNDLFLTLGSKFEHNDYSGFEFQPSARLSWLIDGKQTLWGSISRAVHTPSVSDDSADSRYIIGPVGGGVILARSGDKNTEAEDLIAYEIGYRIQPASNISIDSSLFYNDYNNLLLGSVRGTSGLLDDPILGGNHFIQTVFPVSAGSAHVWGGELTAKWNPADYLELVGGYTLQQLKFDQGDPYGLSFGGKSPQQQFNIRSTVFFPHDVEWNTAVYYTDSLKAADIYTSTGTPAYTRLDTRLAWQALEGLELSLVGQNLLDKSHKEFNGFLYQSSSEIPRAYYGNVTWKF